MSEPLLRHQRVTEYLYMCLADWIRAAPGRGEAGIPVDVVLDDRNVFAPDVWWVAGEHRLARDAPRFYAAPDLAVEVRSPSTWRYDIDVKKDTHERHGLPELWLVDAEAEQVRVHRRSQPDAPSFDLTVMVGRGDAVTSPLLPGFSLVEELLDR